MTDNRDTTGLGAPAPVPLDYPEHFLWALEKEAHRVECRVRDVPHGAELRLTVDGDLWWSRFFETTELLAEAEAKLAQFEAKGWTRPGPRPLEESR